MSAREDPTDVPEMRLWTYRSDVEAAVIMGQAQAELIGNGHPPFGTRPDELGVY